MDKEDVFLRKVCVIPKLLYFKDSEFTIYDTFLREMNICEIEKEVFLEAIKKEIKERFQISEIESFVKISDYIFVKSKKKERVLNLKNNKIRNLKILKTFLDREESFASVNCWLDKKESGKYPYTYQCFEKKFSKEGFFLEEKLKDLNIGEIEIHDFCFGFLLNEIRFKINKLSELTAIVILKNGNLILKSKDLEIHSYSNFYNKESRM